MVLLEAVDGSGVGGGKCDQGAVGLRVAAGFQAAVADVLMRQHEARFSVARLLCLHAVETDGAGGLQLQRLVPQREAQPLAAEFGAADVETEEAEGLTITDERDGGGERAVHREAEKALRVFHGEGFGIAEARFQPSRLAHSTAVRMPSMPRKPMSYSMPAPQRFSDARVFESS